MNEAITGNTLYIEIHIDRVQDLIIIGLAFLGIWTPKFKGLLNTTYA